MTHKYLSIIVKVFEATNEKRIFNTYNRKQIAKFMAIGGIFIFLEDTLSLGTWVAQSVECPTLFQLRW